MRKTCWLATQDAGLVDLRFLVPIKDLGQIGRGVGGVLAWAAWSIVMEDGGRSGEPQGLLKTALISGTRSENFAQVIGSRGDMPNLADRNRCSTESR
jgi:hypothetical protein